MDELHEIEKTTRDILEAVHDVADRVQPPENARAMLLGIGATMIARNMRDGHEPNATEINAIWAKEGFGWRITRLQ